MSPIVFCVLFFLGKIVRADEQDVDDEYIGVLTGCCWINSHVKISSGIGYAWFEDFDGSEVWPLSNNDKKMQELFNFLNLVPSMERLLKAEFVSLSSLSFQEQMKIMDGHLQFGVDPRVLDENLSFEERVNFLTKR